MSFDEHESKARVTTRSLPLGPIAQDAAPTQKAPTGRGTALELHEKDAS